MLTEEKFTQTVNDHMDMVYRIALNYLREPAAAEDVSQEVFLRLFRSGGDFETEQHCKHWLIRVTINECRRALASPWRRLETLDGQLPVAAQAEPEDKSTFRAVMSLPRKYRLVLYLYYYEGYSSAEIAKLLRCPAATVRSQLDRGRKQLKQRLLEAEND